MDRRDRVADIPMPPHEFQALVCGPADTHLFHDAARWVIAALGHEEMCGPGAALLDIGCGCGRVARYLVAEPLDRYTGFDRHAGMVAYCRAAIPDPRFTFDHFDLESAYAAWDGQAGAVPVDSFAFPYAEGAFDHALLASVFTHMPPAEAAHYLGELGRVVRPGGKLLLSVCFSDSGQVETRDAGVNVFYVPAQFDADVDASAFDARPAGYAYLPGQPFQPGAHLERQYGYAQNWYVLRRR